MSTPELDLVVHGATGFTGRQAAAYIAAHAPEGLRWALSGRNADKLAAVRADLGPEQAEREIIVADSLDADAIEALVKRTRVVLTTVGPYARYGSELLGACARHGVHYVDITGETPWVADMLERWHPTAEQTGARIVPFCGFDSVPSDLGAFMMARWIREQWHQDTRSVRAVFKARGGFNGGTAASAFGMMESGETRKFADPFLLNPEDARPGTGADRSRDLRAPEQWDWAEGWVAPFFMAPVNTRVVRRSQALLGARDEGYGEEFSYNEAMWAGRGISGRLLAGQLTLAQGAVEWLGKKAWARNTMKSFAPDPGEGPSEEAMDRGFFRTLLLAEAADGRTVQGLIHSEGDPGNRSTVRMLCEAALTIVDGTDLPDVAGIVTPASALGAPYLARLRATGMRWEVPVEG